ncbi:MAG: helix-turn-helix domain-containing protein [Candidatus Eisenbacteria bacterium]|nr:helix-turn-helix domain-containing protein [Candidatus Eisenbacteria bacterium]
MSAFPVPPAAVPSLDALAGDLGHVAELPREEAVSALVRLAGVQAALAARVNEPDRRNEEPRIGCRLLSATEAAIRLGMSKRWLYAAARAGKLPFARRLSTAAVRFDERGLERWLEQRA